MSCKEDSRPGMNLIPSVNLGNIYTNIAAYINGRESSLRTFTIFKVEKYTRELIISLYVSAMIDLKEIMAADLICSELVRKSSLVRQGGYWSEDQRVKSGGINTAESVQSHNASDLQTHL